MEREGFVILDVKIEEFPAFSTFSDSEYCIGRHNNFFVGRGGEEAIEKPQSSNSKDSPKVHLSLILHFVQPYFASFTSRSTMANAWIHT